MRICLLCYRGNPYCGGQGIYLKYVAEELVRQGHEVHAIVGPPAPPAMRGVTVHYVPNNEYYVKKGASVINPERPFDIFDPVNLYQYATSRVGAFPEISAFSYRAFAMLRELSQTVRFDVIHDNQCLGYGLLLMQGLGVPVIATIHHPLTVDLKNVIERASSFANKVKGIFFYPISMQRFVAKRLDHVITVSEDSRDRITRSFGVPAQRQTVVYNGLDRTIFRPLRAVKKVRGKIVFVGNVEDGKKGFLYLVKALSHLDAEVNLTVVDGGSPHRRVSTLLIEKLGLAGRISFTGKTTTDDLVRHYNEAQIAVVPSTHEGFGFPAAEAMACGTPVIASDGGALPEVVGDAGVIVPARDSYALAEAIHALLADPKKMKSLGAAGQARVAEHFSWEAAVRRMVGVYERVLMHASV
ncbi:MAG TPA: glycosyltransferase family 4 protein [Spirochaetota bacterium]|nr:glycosyltransferase family 4 protein [Spirochaetota bacterium]HPI22791.1 glycosyltransferase family 4 protein [Spirochaetota bacterium]HPU87848.1 glycosyltransferase family 4 protein [Spirochaetota bacterium]